MKEKVINLIERNAIEELKAYFENMSGEKPLDCHEEKVMLDYFHPAAVKSYINRFHFSEDAEILFIDKAPADIRLSYINYYGLQPKTQQYIIKKNLLEVIKDFIRMRHFDDVAYLLKNGTDEAIRIYVSFNKLEEDEQVITLLRRNNKTLFNNYANKWIISEDIKRLIVDEENEEAFKTISYKFYRMFRKKAVKAKDFEKLMHTTLAAEALPPELQVKVLQSHNRNMIVTLLQTCPLSTEAQEVLWQYNYDAEWLKFHIEHLYCMGGYRFSSENEQKLFKMLARKNLDDCLTTFRQQDDVSFVKFASIEAVTKYIKNFWLSDDAQISLIQRGEKSLIKEFITRFSPEHGMCWQAEVELVKLGAQEAIKQYISFHSMCWEALLKLKATFPQLSIEYYQKHPY